MAMDEVFVSEAHEARVAESEMGPLTRRRIVLIGVFLQLVMQSLEADAEDLRGAGFVLPGLFESAQNQQALAFIYGRSYAHGDEARIEGGMVDGAWDLPNRAEGGRHRAERHRGRG